MRLVKLCIASCCLLTGIFLLSGCDDHDAVAPISCHLEPYDEESDDHVLGVGLRVEDTYFICWAAFIEENDGAIHTHDIVESHDMYNTWQRCQASDQYMIGHTTVTTTDSADGKSTETTVIVSNHRCRDDEESGDDGDHDDGDDNDDDDSTAMAEFPAVGSLYI